MGKRSATRAGHSEMTSATRVRGSTRDHDCGGPHQCFTSGLSARVVDTVSDAGIQYLQRLPATCPGEHLFDSEGDDDCPEALEVAHATLCHGPLDAILDDGHLPRATRELS